MIERGPGWELRLGRWQDVLTDVECDAVITDPPYSERTHLGQRSTQANQADAWTTSPRTAIDYGSIDKAFCVDLLDAFGAVKWIVAFGDHISVGWFAGAADRAGRYTFAPIPWCKPDAAPRMQNDGPPTSAEFVHVSRARTKQAIDVIVKQPKGHYVMGTRPYRADQVVIGGKPVPLMREIVRSYSRPGDLVCDPCAGGGTTLLAAVMEGRRAIGAECDPETFEKAVERLRRGFTPALPGLEAAPTYSQGGLWDE